MTKIRIVHVAECAGGVDRYLRMLLRHMVNLSEELKTKSEKFIFLPNSACRERRAA